MAPSILIDSASPDINYSGEQWQSGFDQDVHGGSFNTCRTDINATAAISNPPTMSLSFSGTAISFYGQPSKGFALNYTFDNSRSRVAETNITGDISGKTGIKIWGVDQVAAGFHSISLIPTSGQPSFDYAVVTPTAGYSLFEKILVLDDGDPMIKYTGTWVPQSGKRFPTGITFGDTSRGTSKKGDSLTLEFVGASIAVYGLLNQMPGTLSSTYSIDGGPPTTFVAYNGTQTAAPDVWNLYQRFFFKEVVPGNHTLTVNVSEITGSQVFWIDYLTFEGTSSTSLTPKSTTDSANKMNTRFISGIVGGVIGFLVLYCILRAKCGRWIKDWWTQRLLDNGNYMSPPVHDPAIQNSHQMPLQFFPAWSPPASNSNNPAVPHLQREIDMLRIQNEQIQREASERMRRDAEEQIRRETMEQVRRETEERTQREAAERTQREADERARREAERGPPLRAATMDAGPAEAPPPYNDAHYIP